MIERLHVGVGHDELNAAKADLHHPVHGVASATAHADNFDLGSVPMFRRQRQSERICLATLATLAPVVIFMSDLPKFERPV